MAIVAFSGLITPSIWQCGGFACADVLGITYEEINVWLFCIAWPLTSTSMFIWILLLRRKNRTCGVLLFASKPISKVSGQVFRKSSGSL